MKCVHEINAQSEETVVYAMMTLAANDRVL